LVFGIEHSDRQHCRVSNTEARNNFFTLNRYTEGRQTRSGLYTTTIMAFKITRCGIHAFHEVLGIDTDKIRFYWVLHSDREDAQQTAYHIEVSLHRTFDFLLWDSGKVSGGQQRNILCAPESGLHSASFHYWRVTVWDQDGIEAQSHINEFFTAYPRASGLLPPYSMNQTYVCVTSPYHTNTVTNTQSDATR
jgi:hypothetical protein